MSAVSHDDEKKCAADVAAELVVDGMVVGLGTGSTVAHLLPAIAARGVSIRCVATSAATTEQARALGIEVEEFDRLDRLVEDGRGDRRPDPARAASLRAALDPARARRRRVAPGHRPVP